MAREIPLSRGLKALVDDADFEWMSQFKWSALRSGKGKHFYAARNSRRECVLMHRLLMNPPDGMVVDHINGNSLDNRRGNLRVCTQQQNCANRRDLPPSSGFRGVYRRGGGKFRALIVSKGRRLSLGEFINPVDAARAFDSAAKQLRGEFAALNGV